MGFPEPTNESSQHSGHCHCGAVRFRFALSPPLSKYPANSCNCSICTRNGYMVVYAQKKDFQLETSPDALGAYTFGLERSWHKFCKTCGSSVLIEIIPGKGPELIGVNVRYAMLLQSASKTDRWSRSACWTTSTWRSWC